MHGLSSQPSDPWHHSIQGQMYPPEDGKLYRLNIIITT